MRELLHDRLGYRDSIAPTRPSRRTRAGTRRWASSTRLGAPGATLGRGFGVKLSNTLLVENHKDFFPASEKQMYLSGPPLHVLAMPLVGRFRETFRRRSPISFSAGIDAENFADAVALGLIP